MSKALGLAVLQPDYAGTRIPVMEHFGGLSCEAIEHLTGINPVAERDRLAEAWDTLCELLEVDLLWGGALVDEQHCREIFDWSDGAASKIDAEGEPVVQWGIFHASKAEDGRHFRHITKPKSVDEALDFQPLVHFPDTVEQYRRCFQDQHDHNLNRNGELCYTLPMHYTTAFHWPLAIFGFELLCEVGLHEKRFAALMERFVEITERITTAWSQVDGLRGMILHDDLTMSSGPIFHPDWYRRHIFAHYPRVFAPLIRRGIPIVFTSDGDCSMFAGDIFDAGADGLNFEYLVDLETLVRNWPDKIFIGNINSHTLAEGPIEKIEREVRHCMQAGAAARRFVVNVGGQITHDIPVKHLEYYLDLRKRLARELRGNGSSA